MKDLSSSALISQKETKNGEKLDGWMKRIMRFILHAWWWGLGLETIKHCLLAIFLEQVSLEISIFLICILVHVDYDNLQKFKKKKKDIKHQKHVQNQYLVRIKLLPHGQE